MINLFSSNNQLVYSRKYEKIVDVFANVGGISEILGFGIMFFYAWYNSIRMEQSILNYGILGKSDKGDEEWEKKRFFGFFDLVAFGFIGKGLGCCCT